MANVCGVDYPATMSDVTLILNQIEQGDSAVSEELLPLVDDTLRSQRD